MTRGLPKGDSGQGSCRFCPICADFVRFSLGFGRPWKTKRRFCSISRRCCPIWRFCKSDKIRQKSLGIPEWHSKVNLCNVCILSRAFSFVDSEWSSRAIRALLSQRKTKGQNCPDLLFLGVLDFLDLFSGKN